MKSMLVFLVSLIALSATAAQANNDECQIVDSPDNRLNYYYSYSKGAVYNALVMKGYTIVKENEASADAIRITDMMISDTKGESPVNKVSLYIEITLPNYRMYSASYSKTMPWFGDLDIAKGVNKMIAKLPNCKDL